jgi:hypothetical protein
MNFWDVEIGRRESELMRISPTGKRALGLAVIEETVEGFDRPLSSVFSEETVEFITGALDSFRSCLRSGKFQDLATDAFLEAAYDASDGKAPFAAASLLKSLGEYAEFSVGQNWEEGLLEVMSSCYESVLSYEAIGRVVTIDDERQNTRCVRAIESQLRLIRQAVEADSP